MAPLLARVAFSLTVREPPLIVMAPLLARVAFSLTVREPAPLCVYELPCASVTAPVMFMVPVLSIVPPKPASSVLPSAIVPALVMAPEPEMSSMVTATSFWTSTIPLSSFKVLSGVYSPLSASINCVGLQTAPSLTDNVKLSTSSFSALGFVSQEMNVFPSQKESLPFRFTSIVASIPVPDVFS